MKPITKTIISLVSREWPRPSPYTRPCLRAVRLPLARLSRKRRRSRRLACKVTPPPLRPQAIRQPPHSAAAAATQPTLGGYHWPLPRFFMDFSFQVCFTSNPLLRWIQAVLEMHQISCLWLANQSVKCIGVKEMHLYFGPILWSIHGEGWIGAAAAWVGAISSIQDVFRAWQRSYQPLDSLCHLALQFDGSNW